MTKRKVKKIRDIQPERTPMPVQAPAERVRNFDEVATGYAETDALQEAERCLMCPKAHCVDACPVAIDIPGFIERILEHDYRGAWDVISEANLMPAVCGRVCPQETQCEEVCHLGKRFRPVGIGFLERFLAAWGPMIYHEDEPIAHPSSIALHFVSSLAASEVKVVLTGEGGYAGHTLYLSVDWTTDDAATVVGAVFVGEAPTAPELPAAE